MRSGVVISLSASAILGVGALILAQVGASEAAPSPASESAPSPVRGVPVVVAAAPLAYGVRLEPNHLAVAHYPADAAPAGAYASIAALLNHEGGAPVVLSPMAAKEPLLPAKLSGAGARPSLAAAISDGMRAYAIRISDVAGVGGHALPGDHADVVLTRESGGPMQPDSSRRQARSEVLIQDVKLLGIDLNADPSSTEPALGSTATLEVTVEQAQILAVAAEAGTLSLALRRPGSVEVARARAVSISDVGGGAPMARAPSVRTASRQPADARAAPQTLVLVTQGSQTEQVRVSPDHAGPGSR